MWILLFSLGTMITLLIWELWICEGAHFGKRFVVRLYDLSAARYERIKQFDPDWERHFLGRPILKTLHDLPGTRALDVGAGTGRAARSLIPLPLFDGFLVNLEPSRNMLKVGRSLVGPGPVGWVQGWAVPLPFPAEAYDCVLCLEVLEFTPHPQETLSELVRVLRPGGWLLLTNRVDWQAGLILGRTWPKKLFVEVLKRKGLIDVEVYPWQKAYDLAWARKAWPIERKISQAY